MPKIGLNDTMVQRMSLLPITRRFLKRNWRFAVPQIQFWCSSNTTISCSVLRTFLSLLRARKMLNFANGLSCEPDRELEIGLDLDWFTYIVPHSHQYCANASKCFKILDICFYLEYFNDICRTHLQCTSYFKRFVQNCCPSGAVLKCIKIKLNHVR